MNKFTVWGKEYHHNCKSEKFVIFDYDGTLSNGEHRLHLLPKKDLHITGSWTEFNRAAQYDTPFESTIAVMNAMYAMGYCVIVLTGRSDEVYDESIKWLRDNGARFDFLIMRPATDNRKDTTMKEEAVKAIGLDKIVAAWDDSPQIIPLFRSLGIMTYAVTDYGDNVHEHVKTHGVE